MNDAVAIALLNEDIRENEYVSMVTMTAHDIDYSRMPSPLPDWFTQ